MESKWITAATGTYMYASVLLTKSCFWKLGFDREDLLAKLFCGDHSSTRQSRQSRQLAWYSFVDLAWYRTAVAYTYVKVISLSLSVKTCTTYM